MRMSYLALIPAIACLVALGIPKRFGYFHEALVSFFVFLGLAILIWLFEQKQARDFPFRPRGSGR